MTKWDPKPSARTIRTSLHPINSQGALNIEESVSKTSYDVFLLGKKNLHPIILLIFKKFGLPRFLICQPLFTDVTLYLIKAIEHIAECINIILDISYPTRMSYYQQFANQDECQFGKMSLSLRIIIFLCFGLDFN